MGINLSDYHAMRERLEKNLKHENTDHQNPRLRPAAAKPVKRLPLESSGGSKNPHWYDAAGRFEIQFTVYSIRPADADGYVTKALQDFCVRSGILPEDRWDVVVKSSISSRKAATEEEEKTVVEITAIEL